MDFIDIFSGIGTIRMGFEKANHNCVYSIEIDKHKREMYKVIFGSEPDGKDIKSIKGYQLPKAEIWCFGFPCTDITISRQQQLGIFGGKSSMFFEVMRLLSEIKEENRPELLFIENVKNLFSINKGWDFFHLLNILDERGYDCEWQLFDTANFVRIPQHRERVFIVGHFRGRRTRQIFPIRQVSENPSIQQIGVIEGIKGFDNMKRCYSLNGISPTLNTCNGGNRHAKFYIPTDNGYRIRRLTPREYWRLQGIEENIINKVFEKGFSDAQLYKASGDACTVQVVYEIAKRL